MRLDKGKFSIFTPTYNRSYCLHRVYECLLAQTYKSFEWIIIDDGSSDGTEEIVARWKSDNKMVIIYIKQKNSGKHIAFNKGIEQATGEFFIVLDSDDICFSNALEKLLKHWYEIPIHRRDNFIGITGLCQNESGEIVGNRFPSDIVDSNTIEIRNKYNKSGETWGFQRTEILKNLRYPNIEGEKYISPAYIWNKLSLKYKTRYVNEIFRIYSLQSDSITIKHKRIRKQNPIGSMIYYKEALENKNFNYSMRLKNCINYIRYYLHAIPKKKENFKFNLKILLLLPIGFIFYLFDKVMIRE